jgi:hypothetical protein
MELEFQTISWSFAGRVIGETFYQFFILFGFLLLFGLLLYTISRLTRNVFRNSGYPKLDVYLTGWIGTPVHELGHAFFCLVFGHRITEIKLFSPNQEDGTLGYIRHSYNKKNIYQRIGLFFIGAGPIIFGSLVLYLLIAVCLPVQPQISGIVNPTDFTGTDVMHWLKLLGKLFSGGIQIVSGIFSSANLSALSFWIFIYVSFCISSHMQLSPSDLKSMFWGLFTIFLILLIVNLSTMFVGLNVSDYFLKFGSMMGKLPGLFLLAVSVSGINFLFTYLFLSVIFYLKHRKILSIF